MLTRALPLALALALVGCQRAEQRPPLLLISVDTLRADYLGCYGQQHAQTPNIDALADSGVLFEHALTTAPLTLPAHASLLTGMLPCAHGVRDNVEYRLPAEAVSVAELLSQQGYRSGAFLSSFVMHPWHGLDQGFEHYDAGISSSAAERSCDQTNIAAFRWLRQLSDQPWFMLVHYYEPHRPYQPPTTLLEGSSTQALYAAEVTHADLCVGNLVRLARELSPETRIVLLSDHGEGLGEHDEPEHGNFLYETTLRIPLIISGPGLPRGRRIGGGSASISDVAATLLELAGLDPDALGGGRSLMPAIHSGSVEDLPVYAETLHPRLAHNYSQLKSVSWQSRKLVMAPERELYAWPEDPQEQHNLASQQPAVVEQHLAQLEALVDSCLESALDAPLGEPSAEDREKLMSLGYVGSGAQLSADQELDFSGADPKLRTAELAKYQDAIDASSRREFRQAATLLAQLLESDPDNPMARHTLGSIFMLVGEHGEAARQLERVLEQRPTSFDVRYALAMTYDRLRRYDDGIEVLREALVLHPGRPRVHEKLAQLHEHQGEHDEAARERRTLVELTPADPGAWTQLGDSLLQLGDGDGALGAYRKAQALEPWNRKLEQRLLVAERAAANAAARERAVEPTESGQ